MKSLLIPIALFLSITAKAQDTTDIVITSIGESFDVTHMITSTDGKGYRIDVFASQGVESVPLSKESNELLGKVLFDIIEIETTKRKAEADE